MREIDLKRFDIRDNYNDANWMMYYSVKETKEYYPNLKKLVDEVYFTFSEKYEEIYYENVRKFILNMIRSIEFHNVCWIMYSRDDKNYIKRESKNAWLRRDDVVTIITGLEDKGWIEHKLGFKDFGGDNKNGGIGYVSRYKPTLKFYELYVKHNVDGKKICCGLDIERPVKDERQLLSFRDKKEKKFTGFDDYGLAIIKKTSNEVKDVEFTESIHRIWDDLKRYNNMMKKYQIRLNINDEEREILFKRLGYVPENVNTRTRRIYLEVDKNSSGDSKIRIGGRYCGEYQHIPSEFRRKIEFSLDGGKTWKKTIEVDFQNYQPNILYALADVKPPRGDLYLLDVDIDYFRLNYGFNLRDLVKKIFSRLMWGKKVSGFEKEIIAEMKSKFNVTELFDVNVVKRILDLLLKKHAAIKHYFGKGGKVKVNGKAGLRDFMNYDSEICSLILKSFVKQDKPILSIHDSFICLKSDKKFLVEKARDAFLKVFPDAQFVPSLKVEEYGMNDVQINFEMNDALGLFVEYEKNSDL